MPHQCLNCGFVIPRGSQDILTGCSRCQGKKFMYVNRPMAEDKRLELKGRAEAVRDEIMAKADKRLLSVLEKKGVAGLEGTKFTFEGSGSGWVRVKQDDAPAPAMDLKPEKVEPPRPSARTLIKDYDKAMVEAGKMRPIPDASPRAEEKQVEGITFTRPIAPEPVPLKKAKKKVKKASKAKDEAVPRPKKAKAKKEKKKDDLGVITIVESGVYEINVVKLLDDSPIIIEKDGTYLIHLPSLLEAKAKK